MGVASDRRICSKGLCYSGLCNKGYLLPDNSYHPALRPADHVRGTAYPLDISRYPLVLTSLSYHWSKPYSPSNSLLKTQLDPTCQLFA
jgi:hypothetical protein